MKRIVLTGGGTAGHVTPNLALLPYLLAQGYDVHYIGTANGLEHNLAGNLPGVTYHAVRSGKLRRYLSIENLKDPFRVLMGLYESVRLIAGLRPDILFSKGGFVSVPVVIGAWLNRVPVICHESDMTPGLANRICALFARRIAVTFPECAQRVGAKAVVTGTPLRDSLFAGKRERTLDACGFSGEKPILLMTGGSQGAQAINEALRGALNKLLPRFDIIHLCGSGKRDDQLNERSGYVQFEYVSDAMPDMLAAADIVLARAGSNTICELAALQKPMLLVPYPRSASRGDQVLNAQSFEKRGLCHVLYQENLNAETLESAIVRLYTERAAILKALAETVSENGTQAVMQLIAQYEKK